MFTVMEAQRPICPLKDSLSNHSTALLLLLLLLQPRGKSHVMCVSAYKYICTIILVKELDTFYIPDVKGVNDELHAHLMKVYLC